MSDSVSWSSFLEQCLRDGDLPVWENVNVTHGAMRATGFGGAGGSALVIEALAFVRSESEVQRSTYCFAASRELRGRVSRPETLIGADVFVEHLDDETFRSRVTGVAVQMREKNQWREEIFVPDGPAAESFSLDVLGQSLTVPIDPPTAGQQDYKRLSPGEIVFLQLCDVVERDRVFADEAALRRVLEVGDGVRLFRLDDWQHPPANGAVASSPDLVTMCESLQTGQPMLSTPTDGNCHVRHWLDAIIERQPPEPHVLWGERGDRRPLAELR